MPAVRNFSLAVAIVAGLALGPLPAKALTVGDDYLFSFDFSGLSGTSMSGLGQFLAEYETNGTFQLQSITGSVSGSSVGTSPQNITALSLYAGADNVLYYPSTQLVDFPGISFATGSEDYNIYWNGYYGILESSNNPVGYPNNIEINFGVTFLGSSNAEAAPLPATWTLMMIGLAGLGFFAYRQKRWPSLEASI